MITARTQELTRKASQHFMGPFGEVRGKVDVIIVRGEGCYIWDTNGSSKYLYVLRNRVFELQSLNWGYGP